MAPNLRWTALLQLSQDKEDQPSSLEMFRIVLCIVMKILLAASIMALTFLVIRSFNIKKKRSDSVQINNIRFTIYNNYTTKYNDSITH